jgi:trk system potassium uptake protein TrkH
MNYSVIRFIMGWILIFEAGFMLLPVLVALYFGETAGFSFLISMGIGLVIGVPMVLKKPKNHIFYTAEGYVTVSLSWVILSIMGAAPFVISGCIKNPVDAIFETVSGFTTTGATILTDVEALPKCMLFWRSFTHWIGGMGVLVFILCLLPLTGGSHMNLMKAESPGPSVSRLVPKVQSTAKILYGIYIAMTVLELICLLLAGMRFFDAVTLTFGTAGTGGFGVKNDSIGSYTTLQQGIITVFMILFGVNFNLYFLLISKKVKQAFASEEVRVYFGIIIAVVLMITINTRNLYESVFYAFHHAAFSVGSVITTTGYSTVDFGQWPVFSQTLLVLIMFCGACAGSTGGGIKVSRLLLLSKTIKKEIVLALHPKAVERVKMDGKTVEHDVIRSLNVYMAAYVVIFVVTLLLITLDGFDLVTNFTAVAATINNIGPGLGLVGPSGNFAMFSNFSKLVFSFAMLAGRLEIMPMLLLFSKETWKKF